jgi:hypothetical protein
MNTITDLQITLNLLLMLVFGACSGGDNSETLGNEAQSGKQVIVFHRQKEPNENALSFLLPQNWTISGGITRVYPNSAGGGGNAIEAKLYMKLSSPDNKANFVWLPDTRFFDIGRFSGTNLATSMFPDGSNYNGMKVLQMLNPGDFVKLVAVPFAHPHAQSLQIIGVQQLPDLEEGYRRVSALMIPDYQFNYKAAIVTLEYAENDIQYLEKMICVIEDYGELGAGMWGNRETWCIRAEKGKFESLSPIFATIGQSVRINKEWVGRELRGHQTNSQISLKTQQDISKIENEISEQRANTNFEINNELYLSLTGQEDYANPFTGQTERGTNEWNYRWENEQGDVIYSDNQSYSPNSDVNIQVKGFKRSEIRNR